MSIIEFIRDRARFYNCPVCGRSLKGCDIQVLSHEHERFHLQVTCAQCQVTFIVVLAIAGGAVDEVESVETATEAAAEDRVLLTRDRDLTKRRVIQSGAVRAILIRHDDVTAQLRQVFAELGLDIEQSLTRCIECNAELEPRHADIVAERVPPFVRSTQTRYSECPGCGRIYWAGTHWQHMREVFAGL